MVRCSQAALRGLQEPSAVRKEDYYGAAPPRLAQKPKSGGEFGRRPQPHCPHRLAPLSFMAPGKGLVSTLIFSRWLMAAGPGGGDRRRGRRRPVGGGLPGALEQRYRVSGRGCVQLHAFTCFWRSSEKKQAQAPPAATASAGDDDDGMGYLGGDAEGENDDFEAQRRAPPFALPFSPPAALPAGDHQPPRPALMLSPRRHCPPFQSAAPR